MKIVLNKSQMGNKDLAKEFESMGVEVVRDHKVGCSSLKSMRSCTCGACTCEMGRVENIRTMIADCPRHGIEAMRAREVLRIEESNGE